MVEAGLGHLPFTERGVITPTGRPYVGVDFAKKLCGVSIIRSREAFENALRACCKGVKIGKILIHRLAAPLSRGDFECSESLRRQCAQPAMHVAAFLGLHIFAASPILIL